MPTDLGRDTAVSPVAGEPGHFVAELPDAWSYFHPSGGVLLTLALRAAAATLGDATLRPVSATALFCSAVPAGRVSLRVTTLRRGNATAQLRIALFHGASGELGLEVSTTFARERQVFDVRGATPPKVPGPEHAPTFVEKSRRPGGGSYPFFEQVEMRLAEGKLWWEPDFAPGPARFARWMRYLVPQLGADGLLDPLALPPLVDTMPPALAQALDRDAPWFVAPSLDLTVHFLDPTPRPWLLVAAYLRRARAGYASAEAELWDDEGRLVAYGTQTMMLRIPKV